MGKGYRKGDRIPLWLDCDPGHDDAFAIVLAASHPALHLLGISTSHGNASLDRTTNNALSVLEAIGRPDIPVFPGASKPFCRKAHHAPEIHGESGLEGTSLLPRPTRSALKCNTIVDMYEALMACLPDTAWLVTTGSLTNAALLFTTFPQVVNHLRGLSVMGGSMGSNFTNAYLGKPYRSASGELQERVGNHTPYAEFNIWCDPESAQSVLSNPHLSRKTILIPLDLTHQVLATKSEQDMILHGSENDGPPRGPSHIRLRRMFYELLTFYGHTYAEVFGLTDGPPLHDPLAVAVLLAGLDDEGTRIDFEDLEGERFGVEIELAGLELGRTKANTVGEGIWIPKALDTPKFWHVLNDSLERAGKHVEKMSGHE